MRPIADIVRPLLGPAGASCLILSATSDRGSQVTAAGAVVLASIPAAHPAARILIGAALRHGATVGDGSIWFVLMVVEVLEQVRSATADLSPEQRRAECCQIAAGFRWLGRRHIPRRVAEALVHRAAPFPTAGAAAVVALGAVVRTAIASRFRHSPATGEAVAAVALEALIPDGWGNPHLAAVENLRLRAGYLAAAAAQLVTIDPGRANPGDSRCLRGVLLHRKLFRPIRDRSANGPADHGDGTAVAFVRYDPSDVLPTTGELSAAERPVHPDTVTAWRRRKLDRWLANIAKLRVEVLIFSVLLDHHSLRSCLQQGYYVAHGVPRAEIEQACTTLGCEPLPEFGRRELDRATCRWPRQVLPDVEGAVVHLDAARAVATGDKSCVWLVPRAMKPAPPGTVHSGANVDRVRHWVGPAVHVTVAAATHDDGKVMVRACRDAWRIVSQWFELAPGDPVALPGSYLGCGGAFEIATAAELSEPLAVDVHAELSSGCVQSRVRTAIKAMVAALPIIPQILHTNASHTKRHATKCSFAAAAARRCRRSWALTALPALRSWHSVSCGPAGAGYGVRHPDGAVANLLRPAREENTAAGQQDRETTDPDTVAAEPIAPKLRGLAVVVELVAQLLRVEAFVQSSRRVGSHNAPVC